MQPRYDASFPARAEHSIAALLTRPFLHADPGQTDDEEEEEEEDPAERRRREKDAMLQADLDNARALLGATNLSRTGSAGGASGASGDSVLPAELATALKSAKPTTKDEFEKLAVLLADGLFKPLAQRIGTAPGAGFDKQFLPALFLTLADRHMRDVDMRLASTKLRDAAEKKAKAEKELKRTGGNVAAAAAAATKKAKPKNVSTASAKDKIDMDACELRSDVIASTLFSSGFLASVRSHIFAPAFLRVHAQTATRRSTTTSTSCNLPSPFPHAYHSYRHSSFIKVRMHAIVAWVQSN